MLFSRQNEVSNAKGLILIERRGIFTPLSGFNDGFKFAEVIEVIEVIEDIASRDILIYIRPMDV